MQRIYGNNILSIINPLVIDYNYTKLFIENITTKLMMLSISLPIKSHFNICGPFYQKYHMIRYFPTYSYV